MADEPLQEELLKLQRLNRDQSHRLRQLGLDLPTDLPYDFVAQLDEFVAIQQETGLLSLTECSLEQWLQDRQLEAIDLAETMAASQAHCRQLEAQLRQVRADNAELEQLLEAADKENKSEAERARRLARLDKEIGDNRHKLASMQKVPDDIHLVDIMEKVQKLKALKFKNT